MNGLPLSERPTDPAPPAPDHYDGIIDVSHWELDDARANHRTLIEELTEAKAAGVGFVIAKCTQGGPGPHAYVDPSFNGFRDACHQLGLEFAGYHFPSNSCPGNLQADFYIDTLVARGVDPSKCPLALDRETDDPHPERTQSAADARLFVARCHERTGKYPLLYGNTSFLGPIRDKADILARCPLWIAVYGGRGPRIPAAFDHWTLWQYTDGKYGGGGYPKSTPGFGHIDRSVYRGSEMELRAAWSTLGKP